jgi:hypothetical protein
VWGPASPEGIEHIRQLGWLAVLPECRPGMIGLRHNVVRFKKAGMNYVYCNDNALGLLFARSAIFKTIIFYKSKDDKGVAGYCGTTYVQLLSYLHKIGVEYMPSPQVLPDLSGSVDILGGKKFVVANNPGELIIGAEDELIEMELLI